MLLSNYISSICNTHVYCAPLVLGKHIVGESIDEILKKILLNLDFTQYLNVIFLLIRILKLEDRRQTIGNKLNMVVTAFLGIHPGHAPPF